MDDDRVRGVPVDALLTPTEHETVELAGRVARNLRVIAGDAPTRAADLAELEAAIHRVQDAVLAQAAARAFPARYRTLGGSDGEQAAPGWRCERCRSDRWIGWAAGVYAPRQAQCVPCGWVQALPADESASPPEPVVLDGLRADLQRRRGPRIADGPRVTLDADGPLTVPDPVTVRVGSCASSARVTFPGCAPLVTLVCSLEHPPGETRAPVVHEARAAGDRCLARWTGDDAEFRAEPATVPS